MREREDEENNDNKEKEAEVNKMEVGVGVDVDADTNADLEVEAEVNDSWEWRDQGDNCEDRRLVEELTNELWREEPQIEQQKSTDINENDKDGPEYEIEHVVDD